MSQLSTNTTAFIEAQQYSKFILENLHDGLLPDAWTRDVSDFGSGTTLNIKTIGTATIQDVYENQAPVYNAIDTGNVTLTITDYVGDAWYITDILRQDGSQVERLSAMRAAEATRALQEYFETRFLAECNDAQTASALNNVNGFAHRFVASGTGQIVSLDDFVRMKLGFDKANVPAAGRIALVDPVVEATINEMVATSTAIAYNPMFEGLVTSGFAREHKFVRNIFGFDVYTSNRLKKVASETVNSVTVTGGVANVFMCVSDDNTKPIMRAWRQTPTTESGRNKDQARDEFIVRSRFGLGPQRVDTLGILLTDDTTY